MMRQARTGALRAFFASLVLLLGSAAAAEPAEGPRRALLTGAGGVAFVDNQSCERCHQAVFDKWRGSHHAKAMEHASAESVLGDFNDVVFDDGGAPARFFRRDGRYFIETEGPDGARAAFEARFTFGYHPLQQYLLALPGGRLQAFDIAWDVAAKRWFRILDTAHPLGHPLHWTGRLQNWNSRCAECHSTDLRKNYTPETRSYATSFAEPNVSCQACHGPGADHLAWAEGGAVSRAASKGLVVDLSDEQADIALNTCGRCHSRRFHLTADDRHDAPFFDQFGLARLNQGLYHADGQIDDEVFVLGSFLQSKMRRAGVTCGDCHDPHDAELLAEGDALCVACHNAAPPARFPTLKAGLYDDPAHHRHAAGGPGAQCVDCHMPAATYMAVDPRRDHSFRIPRPDLSAQTGAPDACTGCHQDQDPAWAAARIDEWRGEGWRKRAHFGPAFASARRGDREAFDALRRYLADGEASGLARATAAEHLGDFGPEAAPSLRAAFADESPILRAGAADGLAKIRAPQAIETLARGLDDPSRRVRVAAARALASAPSRLIPEQRRAALAAALKEYEDAQLAAAETTEGRLNLAGLYLDTGRWGEARAQFEEAIAIAPDHAPAYLQFATVLNERAENAEAEQVIRAGMAAARANADLPFALGLLLAEQGRLGEAEKALARAVSIAPSHATAHYTRGVVLYRLGQVDQAEAALRVADAADPNSPQAAHFLIQSQVRRGALKAALADAEALAARFPQSPDVQRLLLAVRQRQ